MIECFTSSSPGRVGVSPVKIVIPCWNKESSNKLCHSFSRRCHAWTPAFGERLQGSQKISFQIAHFCVRAIPFDAVYRFFASPLIHEVGKIDARANREFNAGSQTRINLHEIGRTAFIAPELDLRIAFEVDSTYKALGLHRCVFREFDTLPVGRDAPERRMSTPGPLSKARIGFSLSIHYADRLLTSWKKLLKEYFAIILCELLYSKISFLRCGHELTGRPDPLLLVPKPGFGWFDNRRQANLMQCRTDIALRCEQHSPGNVQPQFLCNCQRALFLDGDL